MLATFADFISQNPNCKKFKNDADMQNIFDFLSQDRILVKLLDASESGKPALAPVAVDIERFFADLSKPHCNTLDDNFTKQAVGLMIKTILEPFGYVVLKQKNLPLKIGATKFQSASTYRFDVAAPQSMKIVKSIEAITPSHQKASDHD